jgi:S-adenosylmethionine hydrolase
LTSLNYNSPRVVALLTDFGLRDQYVGVVKGRILKELTPSLYPHFIDLSHEIPPQDVRKASLVLKFSYKYFPEGTIFLCIVDPGVGTERRAIVLRTEKFFFVGPDNGLFTFILRESLDLKAWEILPERLLSYPFSATFHGRDLFAPAVALLLKAEDLSEWTRPLLREALFKLDFPDPEPTPSGFRLSIWDVDRFGNLITNWEKALSDRPFRVLVDGAEVRLVRTYGEGEEGEVVALFGSEGLLEIAVRNGSALERLGKPRIEIVL